MSDDQKKIKQDLAPKLNDPHRLPIKRDNRRIRRINPLGLRVVVRIEKESDVTDSGLYLPEGAKTNMQDSLLAEVLEVASAHDMRTDEETNVSGVPLGAKVLIPKDAGVRVPWDETFRIVETKDILALVEEISLI